jgi:hypothetical protein
MVREAGLAAPIEAGCSMDTGAHRLRAGRQSRAGREAESISREH